MSVAGVIPSDPPNAGQPFDLCHGGKYVEAVEFTIFQNAGVGAPTDFSTVEVLRTKMLARPKSR